MDFTASDHVKAIYDHMKCAFIDTILVNNKHIPPAIQHRYQKEMAEPVYIDVHNVERTWPRSCCRQKLSTQQNGAIRHDTKKVAGILYSMLVK